jgi:hypothetical protein
MSNGIFRTMISIRGSDFLINGTPTYEGHSYNGVSLEGLLLNARMVQAIFDDLNPETRRLWDYPDGQWDAERNTREFASAMPDWRAHGLLSFTVNLQGGSPFGYSDDLNRPQPWINSAFSADGDLRPDGLFLTAPMNSAWLRSSDSFISARISFSATKLLSFMLAIEQPIG